MCDGDDVKKTTQGQRAKDWVRYPPIDRVEEKEGRDRTGQELELELE